MRQRYLNAYTQDRVRPARPTPRYQCGHGVAEIRTSLARLRGPLGRGTQQDPRAVEIAQFMIRAIDGRDAWNAVIICASISRSASAVTKADRRPAWYPIVVGYFVCRA